MCQNSSCHNHSKQMRLLKYVTNTVLVTTIALIFIFYLNGKGAPPTVQAYLPRTAFVEDALPLAVF